MSTAPQLTISYDLHRAIEDLRSVPVLRRPDEVTFDDVITRDVVDRSKCHTLTPNSSMSENVAQSELSNHTTTAAMPVSFVSPERFYAVQTNGDIVVHPYATVNGSRSSTSSSQSPADQTVNRPNGNYTGTFDRSSSSVETQTSPSDAGVKQMSDSVFADVATPIDADLLVDDVYEREMDELDRLDVEEEEAFDDKRDGLHLPQPSDGFQQRINHNCADFTVIQADGLPVESATGRQFVRPRSYAAERNFLYARSSAEAHRAEVQPQSVHVNTPSSVNCCSTAFSRFDASAEELFEEIVESMKDTISEDDAELDAFTDAKNQLMVDTTFTKSDHGKLETAVGHQRLFSENNAASSVHRPAWPSNRHSRNNETPELKRQKDLTVCLSSTLTECLNALTRVNANAWRVDSVRPDTTSVGRYRKYNITNSDVTYSSSSTKSSRTNSLGRQNVTSTSSGFQSDLMDVDIDEEVDANAAFDDVDLGTVRSATESTSLDSLLDMNDDDDDELYSDQTVVRRPIPSPSTSSDKHSMINGFVEKPTTSSQTTVKIAATDRTEGLLTLEHDKNDGTDKENGAVLRCDQESEKVEVLAEELVTQEIVLNVILPRRSQKENKKRAVVDNCVDHSKSTENGVIERRKSDKTPHRDFHIHRVVRCSNVVDQPHDRLSVSAYPERQKSIATFEGDSSVNEGDSSVVGVLRRSLVSSYVGGPVSVELERDVESATTEQVDEDTRLRVTQRNRVKVLRVPDGSGATLFNAPVTSIRDVVDNVGRTLIGNHQRQPLPRGARVTCDAIQRKTSTSLPDGDVTVIRRTIVDDSDQL